MAPVPSGEEQRSTQEINSARRDLIHNRVSTWVNIIGGLLLATTAVASTYVAMATYQDNSWEAEEAKRNKEAAFIRSVAVYQSEDGGANKPSAVVLENRNKETLHDVGITFAMSGANYARSNGSGLIDLPSITVSIGSVPPCSRSTLSASQITKTEEFISYMKESLPSVVIREATWNTVVSFVDGRQRSWISQEEDPFVAGGNSGSRADVQINVGDLVRVDGFQQKEAKVC